MRTIKGNMDVFSKEFKEFKERLALKCIVFAASHFIVSTSGLLLSMMVTVSY